MFRSNAISFCLLISALGCTAQIVWPKPELKSRFVGDAANIEEAPFQVSIELFFFRICSGSIIGEDLILTAGQCVWRKNERNVRVRVGTDTYGRGGQVLQVEEFILHDDFEDKTKNFDFALIRLQSKIIFDEKKGPIIVSSQEAAADSAVIAYGWNSIGFRRNLQKVNASIIDDTDCSNTYRRNGGITENMICAQIDSSTNRFACGGDVGAALVSEGPEGFVLEGIASWGSGCSRPRNPVVYSKVSAVSDWIQSNAAED